MVYIRFGSKPNRTEEPIGSVQNIKSQITNPPFLIPNFVTLIPKPKVQNPALSLVGSVTRGLSLDPLHHGQRWRISSSMVTPSKPSVPHGFTRSVARCLGPSRSPSKAQSPQSSSRSSSVVTPSKPSVPHAYAHGFTPLVFGPHCSNHHSSLSPRHHCCRLFFLIYVVAV